MDERRAPRLSSHLPHRHPPYQPRHRLRRCDGAPLLSECRTWGVQDDRWRQELEARLLSEGHAWRHRSRHQSEGSEHPVCRDLRHGAEAVDESQRGSRQRHLQDRRWWRRVDEADGRPPHRSNWKNRPRSVCPQPRDPVRHAGQCQPGADRRDAGRLHRWTARRADRRRALSHRQRRSSLDEDERRDRRSDPEGEWLHRIRRRRLRRVHAGQDRSRERQARLHGEQFVAGLARRGQDLERRRRGASAGPLPQHLRRCSNVLGRSAELRADADRRRRRLLRVT